MGTYTPAEESNGSSERVISTQAAEAYVGGKDLTYVECNPLDPEAVSRVITHLLAQVVRQWGTDTITRGETYMTPFFPNYSFNHSQLNGDKRLSTS